MESLTASRQNTVIGDLDEAVALRANYVLFILLSCVIATFGLILSSGAVIIGAMLISPLMSPILAFALAVVVGDPRRAGRSLASLLLGAALAVGLSAALGLLVTGSDQNFLAQLSAEVLSRTQPTLFDLAVALAGGAAAAYALAEPKLSATLAGVAIATALMPPLCVVGLGIALQETTVWHGALLLFLANFVAITFAGAIVFAVRGFAPTVLVRRHLVLGRAVLISTPLLLLLAVPLTLFTARIVRAAQQNAIIRNTLVGGLEVLGGDTLVSFEQQPQQHQLLITATVRAADSPPFAAAKQMENDLAARLREPVALTLLIIPMTRLDPAFPPTATPHAAVATAARVVAPAATAFPTRTPTASPTATSVPTPTPPATPSPTATVAPTRTPVATPTMAPTAPPLAYAVVGGTMREGVNVHQAAGLTPVLTALSDGTVVELTGHRATADGYDWLEVIVPDGTVGWLAQRYLVPYQPYHAPQ